MLEKHETPTPTPTPTMSPPRSVRLQRLLARLQTSVMVLLVLWIGLSVMVPAVVLPLAYFWDEHKEKEVIAVASAGRVLMVSQTTGLFTRSLVETDNAFYSLVDGVSLAKQEAVTLETRGNRSRFLCDSHHRCMKLMTTLFME